MHKKRAAPALAKIDITNGQPRILHYLTAHDGCIQKDISETFDLEPATVSSILSIMEANGLVAREGNSGDRRVLRVFLTKKGATTRDKVEEIFVSAERDCFEGFTDAEKRKTLAFLERIYENLKRKEKAESR